MQLRTCHDRGCGICFENVACSPYLGHGNLAHRVEVSGCGAARDCGCGDEEGSAGEGCRAEQYHWGYRVEDHSR